MKKVLIVCIAFLLIAAFAGMAVNAQKGAGGGGGGGGQKLPVSVSPGNLRSVASPVIGFMSIVGPAITLVAVVVILAAFIMAAKSMVGMLPIAYKNLTQRKSMTALALIGLILGVATVVTLVSISTGIQNLVTERTAETKGVMVLEADQSFGPIFSKIELSDIEKIEKTVGVKNVCPRVMYLPKSIEGTFNDASDLSSSFSGAVIGVRPESESRKLIGPLTTTGDIVRGRFLSPSDSKTVVLGIEIADEYNKAVGSTFKIDGEKFKVVGISETGVQEGDNAVLISYKDAQDLGGLDNNIVSAAFVEVDNPDDVTRMADIIEARVSGVQAISTEEFADLLGGLLSNVEAFLWAISAIAAAVAAINIINTMLMSIMERERELGVMRAIGWTGDDVIKLVMVESILIGVAGGIIGVVVGIIAVEVIQVLIDIRMLVDASLAVRAWAFSVSIGTLAGVYPAWRASKLNPLEAIKSE
ncbi:ABC transporter permease [archaeon]